MNDKDFINQLKSGTSSAYEQLIDEFQQKIFTTCLSFVPNKEDAEDIVQEVFIEVYKSIQNFKGDSKLSTWLYRITTNKCLEFIRKRNAKKRFALFQMIKGDDIPLDRTSFFTEFNHPGILLENKESIEQIFKAINQLPDSQRVVFSLAKLDGKSYQEIVEITGKSMSSVESIMFRAKKSLQSQLENFYKNEF